MTTPDLNDIPLTAFEIQEIAKVATPEELAKLTALMHKAPLPIWTPMPGPQTAALQSLADILWVGGGAGSGKSSLLVGLALTRFKHSRIMRKQSTQLPGIIDEIERVIGSREGLNSSTNIWRIPKSIIPNCKIEFGSCPNPGDEQKYQGRPVEGLCVGKGTPVLMADGSYKPVESIKVGDMVMTLEGAAPVSRLFPSRVDKGVLATASSGQSQVQGMTHQLLTDAGWVSHSMLRQTSPSGVDDSLPTSRCFAYINFEDGARDKIQIHTHCPTSYAHPYTKEIRPTAAHFSLLSLSFSPVEDVELYDFTVEGMNHYITGGGFINKNCYDEICHFNEYEFRFMNGWNRSANPKQRCQIVCTGNPPTTPEGEWVIQFWGPWLDPNHPNPARYGELRWFAMIDGKEVERPHSRPFEWRGRIITPKSRTFIFSTVEDNMFYMATGYDQNLDALPEPLRSQMRFGNFKVGKNDDMWQIFPSDWIDRAQARWTEHGGKGKPMDSMGVDVARGGSDETALSKRHGNWYAKTLRFPGSMTPDGNSVAGLCIMNMKDGAVIHIDIIGVGGSAYDHLNNNLIQVVGVDARHRGSGRDKSGLLRFKNKRAEICWKFRELLDPANEEDIALPPEANLKAELCAFRWKVTSDKEGSIIQVREKDEIKELLGRSPNEAEAVIYASIKTERQRRPGTEDAIQRLLRSRMGGGNVCA